MDSVAKLFDRMDAWRHLPSYQLERRADLFFALYLPQALEEKLGFAIQPELIPEFPVRASTVCPDNLTNRSFKIDYLALSKDAAKAVFVELKTDSASLRTKQDEYLRAAQGVGMHALLEGVLDIFCATREKKKYYCLLQHLAGMGLLRLPVALGEIMTRSSLRGLAGVSRNVEITSQVRDCLVIYVQPNGTCRDIISFQEFLTVVQTYSDPVSRRFAHSLLHWAEVGAGEPRFRV